METFGVGEKKEKLTKVLEQLVTFQQLSVCNIIIL